MVSPLKTTAPLRPHPHAKSLHWCTPALNCQPPPADIYCTCLLQKCTKACYKKVTLPACNCVYTPCVLEIDREYYKACQRARWRRLATDHTKSQCGLELTQGLGFGHPCSNLSEMCILSLNMFYFISRHCHTQKNKKGMKTLPAMYKFWIFVRTQNMHSLHYKYLSFDIF